MQENKTVFNTFRDVCQHLCDSCSSQPHNKKTHTPMFFYLVSKINVLTINHVSHQCDVFASKYQIAPNESSSTKYYQLNGCCFLSSGGFMWPHAVYLRRCLPPNGSWLRQVCQDHRFSSCCSRASDVVCALSLYNTEGSSALVSVTGEGLLCFS